MARGMGGEDREEIEGRIALKDIREDYLETYTRHLLKDSHQSTTH